MRVETHFIRDLCAADSTVQALSNISRTRSQCNIGRCNLNSGII